MFSVAVTFVVGPRACVCAGNAQLQLNAVNSLIGMATSVEEVNKIVESGIVDVCVSNMNVKVSVPVQAGVVDVWSMSQTREM